MGADGKFINYLSGNGLATSIELASNSTIHGRISDDLKAMLGKDFTTIQLKSKARYINGLFIINF